MKLHRVLLSALFLFALSLLQCGGKEKKASPVQSEGQVLEEASPSPVKEIEDEKAKWSYRGATGPEFWGELDETFKVCQSGNAQSPVNLIWSRPIETAQVLISYESSLLRLVDNGQLISLAIDPGSQISIQNKVYNLLEVHFHTPSEHRFSGKSYPVEIHYVHQNEKGEMAVLGVMGTVGRENPVFAKILAKLPIDRNKEFRYLGEMWEPKALLPEKKHYYSYSGSLEMPPCTEGVSWNVLNTPLEFSLEQINAFQQIYVNNNRPLQPLNGRGIKNY